MIKKLNFQTVNRPLGQISLEVAMTVIMSVCLFVPSAGTRNQCANIVGIKKSYLG